MLGYVIGDGDMVTGFKLVGVEGTEVSSIQEAMQALDTVLARKDIAIIIISEEFSSEPALKEEIAKVRQEKVTPMILELPGSKSKTSEIAISTQVSKILGVKI